MVEVVMLRLTSIALALLVFVASAPAYHVQPVVQAQNGAQGESSPTLEAARARWERLSPEEKARLEKNYERYRSLTEEERRGLANRSRRLDDERERVSSELPPQTREKLQQLDPEKRREVMRDLVEGELRERGARIREKMPEAWVQRLEEARPEDRARFLAEFQRRARERVTLAAIDKIGRKLELPREETERLKALPSAERAAGLLELKKRLSAKDAELYGLPAGITQAQWDEWQSLPPAEFFEVMQRYRHEREIENRGAGAPGGALRAIDEAMRPRPDDIVEMAQLAPGERRQKIFQLRRDRIVRIVREHNLLPPDKINQLEHLSEGQFLRALREFVVRPLTTRAPAPSEGVPRPHRD
jgi:hypothetical protein